MVPGDGGYAFTSGSQVELSAHTASLSLCSNSTAPGTSKICLTHVSHMVELLNSKIPSRSHMLVFCKCLRPGIHVKTWHVRISTSFHLRVGPEHYEGMTQNLRGVSSYWEPDLIYSRIRGQVSPSLDLRSNQSLDLNLESERFRRMHCRSSLGKGYLISRSRPHHRPQVTHPPQIFPTSLGGQLLILKIYLNGSHSKDSISKKS